MTSVGAPAHPHSGNSSSGFARARRTFRAWRRTRPFWAGLLVLLAAAPIIYFPYFNLSLGALSVAMSTTAGAGSLVIGLTLIVLGGLLWFQPIIRFFAGCVAVFLGVLSLPISNFGGFFIGTLFASTGGLLALAWGPVNTTEDTKGPSGRAGE
ncbi:DUF6114 domain-containing protein [Streptomyces sp. ME08-AFT2]|uniref:DUF6114 domain-containing protein n=1 Tax=Streptomyces sp. ME08-AFT2 TaxID=3028683 RepID=UPI0029B9BDC6|nr:DUF6114 domain-containing protein [Streptomyces sp. ME08-AFT2]MDX3313513.1 DUF6114 domain-containing protein [Streptomyces sp. ME08-AFT2]